MKQNTKEAEKLKELLAQAENHPMMKAIKAEAAAAELTERKDLCGKIEVLKKERDEVFPKLQADCDAKEENYLTAKNALTAATDEFRTAKQALTIEIHSFDTAIRIHETALIETADPQIDDAITFFKEKLDYLRSPGRISRNAVGSERNIFRWSKTTTQETNAPAVRDAMAYCQAAIKLLERMKVEPVLDGEMIERMKAAIPDINVYTEVTGEKDMERGPADPLHPLVKLAEDSEREWKLGKLLEKVDKLLVTPMKKKLNGGRTASRSEGYLPKAYERR